MLLIKVVLLHTEWDEERLFAGSERNERYRIINDLTIFTFFLQTESVPLQSVQRTVSKFVSKSKEV